MNPDKEYEELTRNVFQLILKKEGHDTINVQHDIKLIGKSGVAHQIDVFWEFIIGGINHRVAIECKNYNTTISLGKIRDFSAVLSDIGNVRGIMVTKVGYQSGVIEYAAHNDIPLKLLRDPKDEDWHGRLKRISFNINLVTARVVDIKVNVDLNWVKENISEFEIAKPHKLSGFNNEVWVFNSNGEKHISFLQLEDKLPRGEESQSGLTHSFKFDDHFIEVVSLGRIKLNEIIFTYDVISTTSEEILLDASDIVDKVLIDIATKEIKFIHKDGKIR